MKNFLIGCNYWASDSGIYMWRNFNIQTIQSDLDLLVKNGVDTVRVFPLWSDFQPLISTDMHPNSAYGIRGKDGEEVTEDGLSISALQKFEAFLKEAEKRSLKVIVSLITGWMSGRMFFPELLRGENLLSSPKAIVWECRFIKGFIPRFLQYDCIIAWEPGNETNVMSVPSGPISANDAELWVLSITNAIRSVDPKRPILAGMHGLNCTGLWNLPMEGRYFDQMTTHPYPLFTPFCATEEITSLRPCLHAAAESVYYASVSGKQCMVEEIGTLGPMIIDDSITPKYLETSLATSFQYGTTGYLWWCAFDQDQFDYPPYDVNAIEQNLGLAYDGSTPKPILQRLASLKAELECVGELPKAKTDAVVILTSDQDQWKVAYGAFLLALQAGFNVEFQYQTQPLKKADHYILPCIQSCSGIPKDLNFELQERIRNGAKLLITYGGGYLGYFNRLTGLTVSGREEYSESVDFSIGEAHLSARSPVRLLLETAEENILSRDHQGRPIFTKYANGKGAVYFLNLPLENLYSETAHPEKTKWHLVYNAFLKEIARPFAVLSNQCAVTCHPYSDGSIGVFVTNLSGDNKFQFKISDKYAVSKTIYAGLIGDTMVLDRSFAYLVLKPKDRT